MVNPTPTQVARAVARRREVASGRFGTFAPTVGACAQITVRRGARSRTATMLRKATRGEA